MLFLHIRMCIIRVPGAQRSEKGILPPGTGLTNGYKMCGCWKMDPGPLQWQSVLLSTEPCL